MAIHKQNDRGLSPSPGVQQNGSFSSEYYGPGGNKVLSVAKGEMPGASAIFPGSISSAHYGMNNRAHRLVRDGAKILLVEYKKTVADVAGLDAADIWTDMVAPRHFDTLNVLYVDGHVEAHRPEAIDPEVLAIQKELWLPASDL